MSTFLRYHRKQNTNTQNNTEQHTQSNTHRATYKELPLLPPSSPPALTIKRIQIFVVFIFVPEIQQNKQNKRVNSQSRTERYSQGRSLSALSELTSLQEICCDGYCEWKENVRGKNKRKKD
jgi:hypothetical protein